MKKQFLVSLLILLAGSKTIAQSFAINTTGATADASSILDITSTIKGMLIPRMTMIERTAIATPATGLIVYDNTLQQFYYYNGTAWTPIATGGAVTNYWTLSGGNIYNNTGTFVGIGLTSPSANLDITGTNAGTNSLLLRSGNTGASFTSNQILLGYNNTTNYKHAIKSRHNSSAASGNAIDFYVWNFGTDAVGTIGTKQALTLDGTGFAGIGTTTPSSLTHVSGGNFLVTGTFGSSAAIEPTGSGTRMFFNPRKAAFRAGFVGGTQWNDANVGNYSFSAGQSSVASNDNTIAIGYLDSATNTGSISIGTGNKSTGAYAFTGGFLNTASNTYSVAFGNSNTASGFVSFAGGNTNTASGNASTAFGFSNTASGLYSFAQGTGNVASNTSSITMGTNDTASNGYTIAIGLSNNASAFSSIAIGNSNKASGNESVAMGYKNITSANQAFAAGQQNTASGVAATAFGATSVASGTYSFAAGVSDTASGFAAVAIGNSNKASGSESAAFGFNNKVTGANSFAAGTTNSATATNAVSFGSSSVASNSFTFTTGLSDTASGFAAIAMGNSNRANGNESFAIGYKNKAYGHQSLASGQENYTYGRSAVALGNFNYAPSYGEVTIGNYATTYTAANADGIIFTDRVFTIGNGVLGNRSDAMVVLKSGYTGVGNSSPTSRLSVNGSVAAATNVTNGSLTLDGTHYCVIYNGGTGNTFTLPVANTCTGRIYIIINQGTDVLATSVYRSGNATTATFVAIDTTVQVISDGTEWRKMN